LYNCIDTGNVSRAISHAGIINVLTASGVAVSGIRLGTDGTAATPADCNLVALIGHGVADNVLSYGAVVAPTVDVIGDTVKLHVKRAFINGGSVPITVRELDLVAQNTYYVEYLRDAIPDQVIASFDGVTVEIIIQITV
jgi:hypothetical protein